MIQWMIANAGTILVCGILIGVVTAIIVTMIKNKKAGKPTCSGCASCGLGCTCNSKKE